MQKMRQGDYFLFFNNAWFEVKTTVLQFSFNIFR